jgi:hypothetical protein
MAEEQKENWAIVVSGVAKYVGNVVESGEDWVSLNPCFEYTSDLQIAQGPQPGQLALMGRTKILVPYDHTVTPFPVYCRISSIAYVNGMDPADRKIYEEAIGAAKSQAEQMRRKRDSNLIIVPGGALPKGDPPRAS